MLLDYPCQSAKNRTTTISSIADTNLVTNIRQTVTLEEITEIIQLITQPLGKPCQIISKMSDFPK